MLGAGALGRPRGMVWGGRREEGSGWGTHVYLWQIHFDIRQNEHNIVKFKNKIKLKKKHNIQKTKIMASSPITSWQIDGETVETVRDFNFGGSKITADADCSHEIKRCLLLGRKAMTNQSRQHIKKQRHCRQRSVWSKLDGFSSGHVWM